MAINELIDVTPDTLGDAIKPGDLVEFHFHPDAYATTSLGRAQHNYCGDPCRIRLLDDVIRFPEGYWENISTERKNDIINIGRYDENDSDESFFRNYVLAIAPHPVPTCIPLYVTDIAKNCITVFRCLEQNMITKLWSPPLDRCFGFGMTIYNNTVLQVKVLDHKEIGSN